MKLIKTHSSSVLLRSKAGQLLDEAVLAESIAVWRECRAEDCKPHECPGDAGPFESHLGPGSESETGDKRYQTDWVFL